MKKINNYGIFYLILCLLIITFLLPFVVYGKNNTPIDNKYQGKFPNNQHIHKIKKFSFYHENQRGKQKNNQIQIRQFSAVSITGSWMVRLFQILISPQDGPNCSKRPTCSQYSRQVINKFSMAKGVVLTSDRLLRCHPGLPTEEIHEPPPKYFCPTHD